MGVTKGSGFRRLMFSSMIPHGIRPPTLPLHMTFLSEGCRGFDGLVAATKGTKSVLLWSVPTKWTDGDVGRRLTCEVGVDCGSSTSERVPQWAPPLNRPGNRRQHGPGHRGTGMPEKPGCVEFPGDSTPIHPVPRTIVQFISGRMTTCQVRAQRLAESFKHSRQASECCVSFDSLVSYLGHRQLAVSPSLLRTNLSSYRYRHEDPVRHLILKPPIPTSDLAGPGHGEQERYLHPPATSNYDRREHIVTATSPRNLGEKQSADSNDRGIKIRSEALQGAYLALPREPTSASASPAPDRIPPARESSIDNPGLSDLFCPIPVATELTARFDTGPPVSVRLWRFAPRDGNIEPEEPSERPSMGHRCPNTGRFQGRKPGKKPTSGSLASRADARIPASLACASQSTKRRWQGLQAPPGAPLTPREGPGTSSRRHHHVANVAE